MVGYRDHGKRWSGGSCGRCGETDFDFNTNQPAFWLEGVVRSMSKLPRNIKAKQLISALERHGFRQVSSKGSHIRLAHSSGRWTQVAVHPKPIPPGTLRAILRQTELKVEDIGI